MGETSMQWVLGILMLTQLSLPPGASLPQVMSATFKPPVLVKAGQIADIVVSFNVVKGFVIDRSPQITLKLSEIPGVELASKEIAAFSVDPKSKDEYFVDLPTMRVQAVAEKAGQYVVPGKLTYFFCNKADGF